MRTTTERARPDRKRAAHDRRAVEPRTTCVLESTPQRRDRVDRSRRHPT
jgi:hypothetical protein